MTDRPMSLFGDTRGAMMLMSLFLGLFLVGSLYYLLGIGDALIYRRTMQDGADAGAFAASVVAAKGMNLHALLNVVMAITAGILLVLRSVEVLLEILLSILRGLAASIVLAPKALPLIAILTPVESTVQTIGDGVEQFVRIAHDALDVAHEAVQRGYPLLAEARAVDVMAFQEAYRPPVVAGFVAPLRGAALPRGERGLPVEPIDVGVLCDRAANGLADRIRNVSSRAPKWLFRFLGGTIEKALKLGKRRTCDDDVVESPRAVISTRDDASEVWLGHEEFQYRAYNLGEDPRQGHWQTGERGIRIAQGGRDAGRDHVYQGHVIGRVGFAQSEYYFDGAEHRAEWLWKQRWRARLRRFRVPHGHFADTIGDACGGPRGTHNQSGGLSGICGVVRSFPLDAISVH